MTGPRKQKAEWYSPNDSLGNGSLSTHYFWLLVVGLSILFTLAGTPLNAVILYGTADPSANTSAPTGALANSGWQYQGEFGGFLGTPIASNYFITAKHIGGSVGQTFTFDGTAYTTTAVFPDPSSDLQIWRVAGTFPVHASIYSGGAGSELNLGLTVFGRGTQRGDALAVGNDSHLGGWLWGPGDGVQRWGTNVIDSIQNDSTYGKLLRAAFDVNGGPNEAQLSSGDSGGAVFVFNAGANRWELAGINLAVDGPFSTSPSGTNPFNGAMFDTSGLFVQDDQGNWVTAPNPSAFYATEIAAREGFIDSVVMQLVSAVSRKTHGSAGTFDIDLPQTVKPGIECRTGGPTNDHTILFTFSNNVSVGAASVTSGIGTVMNFNVTGNEVTVNLTGVPNGQTIVVTLIGVSDGTNTSNVQATMGVLFGDVSGNGTVSNTDVAVAKSQVGAAVDSSNFRNDLTTNGIISNTDVSATKSQVGTSLP
jgi:hypothetical protein